MFRYLIFIFLTLSSFMASAQKADTLFVKQSAGGWVISHKIKAGETIFSIARRYHVPPATLADYNSLSLQQPLSSGNSVYVPVAAYNLVKVAPATMTDVRRLYHRVDEDRTLPRIARNTGVSPQAIKDWNSLKSADVYKGQVLMVGWLLYDATDVSSSSKPKSSITTSYPDAMSGQKTSGKSDSVFYYSPNTAKPDTAAIVTEGERIYLQQTMEGVNAMEERGTAAFFKRAGQSTNGIYFAFHNTAPRGTVIKIYNPGTEKTVYAKVIGTVPTTAAFHNAILGISGDAMRALDVRQEKAWVEISYRR